MQKIKRQVVKKILKEISSVNQLDLLLYISQYQNDAGIVNNIFYKDVCLKLKMSPQTFYNALYSLERKGFLIVAGRHGVFDIRVIDNYFFNKDHYREGYLDLAKYPFVFSFSFLSQSLTTKKIALKLLLDITVKKSFKVGIEKIREWVGCSLKEVNFAISQLDEFFYISSIDIKEINSSAYKKEGHIMFIFKIKDKTEYKKYKHTNLYKYVEHKIRTIMIQFKINYTTKDLFDIYYLFKSQYKKIPKILSALYHTIKEKGTLEPKLINYIINQDR